jgi:hypothetical protein
MLVRRIGRGLVGSSLLLRQRQFLGRISGNARPKLQQNLS